MQILDEVTPNPRELGGYKFTMFIVAANAESQSLLVGGQASLKSKCGLNLIEKQTNPTNETDGALHALPSCRAAFPFPIAL